MKFAQLKFLPSIIYLVWISFFSLFAKTDNDYTNINYGFSPCALRRASKAADECDNDKIFNRFEVESAIYTRNAHRIRFVVLNIFLFFSLCCLNISDFNQKITTQYS